MVLLLYFAAPDRLKNSILLIASIFFYAWGEPVYVVLMLFSILFNYVLGIDIGRSEGGRRKRNLIYAIIINILILGFFKYYGFCVEFINSITPLDLEYRELPLPIGISFYTFQAMSYIIDVYKGKVESQKNIIHFATFISMFPQLVAGPIVKYTDIADQLKHRDIERNDIALGMERLVLGLAKKVLLANNLGFLYTTIQAMDERTVLLAWIGILAYTLQIYFDFSGYSDMAIGMGRMMGFKFPENFNYPYISKSITEFWRRWHMTLSFWFRDYVYIPMGGSRVSTAKQIRNILVVWMLTGLWHGAAWNFVFWGVYFGLLLLFEKFVLNKVLYRTPGFIQHIYAMLFVIIGWVFFSNTDFGLALEYLGNMFGVGVTGFADGTTFYYLRTNIILIIAGIFCSTPFLVGKFHDLTESKPVIAAIMLVFIAVICVSYLVYSSYNPFLYFRF